MDDTDSENDAVNPDSEAEMLFSEEEAEEEPGQSTRNKASTSIAASSKASAKKRSKREHSRRLRKNFCYKESAV